jgi:hypothetical protein
MIRSAIVNATQGFWKENTGTKVGNNGTLRGYFLVSASSMILKLNQKEMT